MIKNYKWHELNYLMRIVVLCKKLQKSCAKITQHVIKNYSLRNVVL